jgi:hypothetical protein
MVIGAPGTMTGLSFAIRITHFSRNGVGGKIQY